MNVTVGGWLSESIGCVHTGVRYGMILLIWKGRDVFGDLPGRRSVIGYILIYYDCDVFGGFTRTAV